MANITAASAPRLAKIGKVEIGYETTFGGGSGAYSYLRCDPPDLSGLTEEAMEDTSQRHDLSALARIVGPKGGELTLKGQWFGTSSSVPTGAPAAVTDHALGPLLAWLIGACKLGGYISQDPTGSTTALLKGADLSGFPGGDIFSFVKSGTTYVNASVSVDTGAAPDELTPLQTFAAAAVPSANPTAIIGGLNMYKTAVASSFSAGVTEGFAIKLYGHASDLLYTCVGCVPTSFKLTAERNKPAVWELKIKVASWSSAGSGGAPAAGSWSAPAPEAWTSWRCFLGTAQTSLRTGKLDIEIDAGMQPVQDGAYPGGVGGWVPTTRTIKVSMQVDRAEAQLTAFDAQTTYPFIFAAGSQPGKLFAVRIPAANITALPAVGDEDGRLVSKLELGSTYYTGDSGAGAAADSEFSIGLL